ncbi:Uncharacterised protein [Acinetobacter baumannii]|nr:Uncharacterised protein [Acinetobacter baumannii]
MQQQVGLALQLIPLVERVVFALRRLRLGVTDPLAAFVAADQETAWRRAVERSGGQSRLIEDERRGGHFGQAFQRFGADRTKQDVDALQRAGFGAFHQAAPVFRVAQVNQRVFQPYAVVFRLAQILRFQHDIGEIVQQDHAGFLDGAGQLRVDLLIGAARMQLTADRRQQGCRFVYDFRFRLRQRGGGVPIDAGAVERCKIDAAAAVGRRRDIAHAAAAHFQRVADAQRRGLQRLYAGHFHFLRALQPGHAEGQRQVERDIDQQQQQNQRRAGDQHRIAAPLLQREILHFVMQRQEAPLPHHLTVEIDVHIGGFAQILRQAKYC